MLEGMCGLLSQVYTQLADRSGKAKRIPRDGNAEVPRIGDAVEQTRAGRVGQAGDTG